MHRPVSWFAVLVLAATLAPAGAGAETVASDIELVSHHAYGDPTLSGTSAFFAGGTDLAFDGRYVYASDQAGSGDTVGGVHILDVVNPNKPRKVGFIDCPASQNDVAVVEPGVIALAYHSESVPGDGNPCTTAVRDGDGEPTESTQGVRLYDVSNPRRPVALGVSPSLPGGTHTLTVSPDGNYIYASPGGLPTNGGATQQILDISDRNDIRVHTFQPNRTGCHDFSFFTATDGTPMGVCVGLTESQIWDVSDPTVPVIVSRIHNPLIQFHHTGIVTDDGRTLVIGDEAVGANECVGGPTGAMFSYDISDPALPIPQGYFGIDRAYGGAPASSSNAPVAGYGRDAWCTAHLYNFIPGTAIMVAVWYSGGLNIIDWTDPTAPRELAYYQMPEGDYAAGEVTNYWSGYWHAGRIYANDRVRGLDALRWTAFDERFPRGGASPSEITEWAQSLRSGTRAGWHAGRFLDQPTPAQASWLASAPTPSLSPYACRLAAL